MQAFLAELADILERDAVGPDELLTTLEEWDSLAVLSVIAMVDSKYNVRLSAGDLRAAATGAALWSIVESKAKA